MGNRFRDKVVEEGLDGEWKEEIVQRAMSDSPAAPKRGNRRRVHAAPAPAPSESGERRKEKEEQKSEKKERKQKEMLTQEPEQEIVDEVEENKGPTKGGKVAKGLAKVLGGDILADKLVLRQIPLLLLCMVFLLLIVGVRYRVESLSRAKMAKEEQINELREKRIRILRSNQETVKISQIAKELKETGVGITSGPPYEI
jgi:hypothetical protein